MSTYYWYFLDCVWVDPEGSNHGKSEACGSRKSFGVVSLLSPPVTASAARVFGVSGLRRVRSCASPKPKSQKNGEIHDGRVA